MRARHSSLGVTTSGVTAHWIAPILMLLLCRHFYALRQTSKGGRGATGEERRENEGGKDKDEEEGEEGEEETQRVPLFLTALIASPEKCVCKWELGHKWIAKARSEFCQ
ncbi:hypothetical protein E2C01_079466 [Portunus trituberculatus]|uniref:Uncharacterized protein n=1 Tax=Portunus trituberculatus TaxID=210409 RepID=A0A5B7IRH6_PORTR|nr:hypothetical protein [Portunus trituberculatus]